MRVAITGGTGLVGRALCERLLDAGHEILVLSRHPGVGRSARERQVAWPGGDTQTYEAGAWQSEVAGCDAVVHLAGASIGQGRWTAAVREQILRSRVVGTRRIVEAMRAGGPTVLVTASAVGYYGDGGDRELVEDAPPGNDFAAGVCRRWEEEAVRAEEASVRVARARLGIVLARHGGALERMLLPFRMFVGGPVGSGRQWISWVHLEDAVSGLMFLLSDAEASGAFNLTAQEPVRSRDFARAIGAAMGRPSYLPAPAVMMRLMFGEMAEVLLLSGQRAL
ncbi:hypothetical protein B1A_10402, partial [mine drainage metagenome]